MVHDARRWSWRTYGDRGLRRRSGGITEAHVRHAPRLVEAVATAWRQIPAEQRGSAVIYAGNYGEAAAIDRFGPAYGLPTPYSGHMSYADWGPPPAAATGPVLVVSHRGDASLGRVFTGCRLVGRFDNGYGVDNEEQGVPLRLCDGPQAPWPVLWPALRHYS